MDRADLVGYIVAEDAKGDYIYACGEHTPEDKRESHRMVLRAEAVEDGITCRDCGLELAETEAIEP